MWFDKFLEKKKIDKFNDGKLKCYWMFFSNVIIFKLCYGCDCVGYEFYFGVLMIFYFLGWLKVFMLGDR